MEDPRVHDLYQQAVSGVLNRREVLKRAAALGLGAPVVAAILAACGGSSTTPTTSTTGSTATTAASTTTTSTGGATPSTSAGASPVAAATSTSATSGGPTKRGGGGQLKLLWWEAPTILNPHLAQGTKDFDASRVVLEPLADFDSNGNLVPFLAAEIPSTTNGGVSSDGKSVTWKLKQGVKWADGQPFSSADVKFTFDFITNKATGATTLGNYLTIASVDAPDDYTVTVNFKNPTPGWFGVFCGIYGMILPQHVMANYVGANARNAPFNLKPIGTGAYSVTSFTPGDNAQYAINDNFREANAPFFDTISLKGGGDATSAARASIQTGEVDYGWNLQVPANVLKSLETPSSPGKLIVYPGNSLERILINMTDPNTSVNGEKSHLGTPHPFQSILDVRKAYNLAVQRDVMANTLYGPAGTATANVLVAPPAFVSKNTSWKYDLTAAGQLLDQAGFAKGSDGIRAKGSVKMAIVFQTTVNTLRQQEQELVKNSFGQLGINVTLKSVQASVFFSSDAGNPDTAAHFYTDLEMFTNGPATPYPTDYMVGWWGDPSNIAQKSNQWAGNNYERWQNSQYDSLYQQSLTELDPAKQAQLFIQMNDLVVNNAVDIPEVARNGVSGANKKLQNLNLGPWTSELWNVSHWTMSS
ncbi:MAG TPA: peptide ABC transporter substrate-binding protein [Thermomicrobiaceae bacterium]|nr:peptide ABC transporter substrate-binding protein [Thermomicrobiaceae bacterium]